jgi:hypothetical protein
LPSMLAHHEAIVARFVNKALEIHFALPSERADQSA